MQADYEQTSSKKDTLAGMQRFEAVEAKILESRVLTYVKRQHKIQTVQHQLTMIACVI